MRASAMATDRYLDRAPFDEERRRRQKAGEPARICRWCGGDLPARRSSFCGDACVQEFTIRRSATCARAAVFGRDRGICAICGLDTEALRKFAGRLLEPLIGNQRHVTWKVFWKPFPTLRQVLRALWALRDLRRRGFDGVEGLHYLEAFERDPDYLARLASGVRGAQKAVELEVRTGIRLPREAREGLFSTYGIARPRLTRSFWQADHRQAVVQGGGACGVENFRTLCCPCHKAETRRLVRDLARERRAARVETVDRGRGQKRLGGLDG